MEGHGNLVGQHIPDIDQRERRYGRSAASIRFEGHISEIIRIDKRLDDLRRQPAAVVGAYVPAQMMNKESADSRSARRRAHKLEQRWKKAATLSAAAGVVLLLAAATAGNVAIVMISAGPAFFTALSVGMQRARRADQERLAKTRSPGRPPRREATERAADDLAAHLNADRDEAYRSAVAMVQGVIDSQGIKDESARKIVDQCLVNERGNTAPSPGSPERISPQGPTERTGLMPRIGQLPALRNEDFPGSGEQTRVIGEPVRRRKTDTSIVPGL